MIQFLFFSGALAQENTGSEYLFYLQKNCITSNFSDQAVLFVRSKSKVKKFHIRRFKNASSQIAYSFSSNKEYDEYLYVDVNGQLQMQYAKKKADDFRFDRGRADWIVPGFELQWLLPEYFWKFCIVGSGREFNKNQATLKIKCKNDYANVFIKWNPGKRECPKNIRVYDSAGILRFFIDYEFGNMNNNKEVLKKVKVISIAHEIQIELIWTRYYDH